MYLNYSYTMYRRRDTSADDDQHQSELQRFKSLRVTHKFYVSDLVKHE